MSEGLQDKPKEFSLSKDKCLEIGGHCYNKASELLLISHANPQPFYRYCIHCGHTQQGIVQPSLKWIDAEEKSQNA